MSSFSPAYHPSKVRVILDRPADPRMGWSTGWLWVLAVGIFLLALFIRVADLSHMPEGRITFDGLSAWPFIHDEAIHSVFSLGVHHWMAGGNPEPRQYDPTYHGPLQYYLVALSYWINGGVVAFTSVFQFLNGDFLHAFGPGFWKAFGPAAIPESAAQNANSWTPVVQATMALSRFWAASGDTEAASRMPSVIFGSVMCALPLAFTRRMGLKVTLTACALLLFCSPTHSYYSRIVLYDIMCTTVEVAAAACFFQGLSTNRLKWFGWAVFFVACDLYLKPTALLWGVMLTGIGLYELTFGPDGIARGQVGAARRLAWMGTTRGWKIFLTMVFLGWVGWVLLYTDFGKWPAHWMAINEMIGHWMSIHGQPRLNGAKWYYLDMIAIYDPLLLLGLLVAVPLFLFHRDPAIRFFSLWSLLAVGVYAVAGEKGPWLINHVVVPATIPTAWGLVAVMRLCWHGLKGVWGWILGQQWLTFKILAGVLGAPVVAACLAVMGGIGLVAGYQAYSTWHLLYIQPAWDGENLAMSVRAQEKTLKREFAALVPTTAGRWAMGKDVIPHLVTPDRWELMTYVATTRDFDRLTKQLLLTLNGPKRGPEGWRGRVAVVDEPQWPLAWYLRESQVPPGSVSFEMPKDPQNFEMIVVPWYDYDLNKQKDTMDKLSRTHYPLEEKIPQRAWWTPRFLAAEKDVMGEAELAERVSKVGPLAARVEVFARSLQGVNWETLKGHILHRNAYEWHQYYQRDKALEQLELLRKAESLKASILASIPKDKTQGALSMDQVHENVVHNAAAMCGVNLSEEQVKDMCRKLASPGEIRQIEQNAKPTAPLPGVYYLNCQVWRHKGS